MLLNTERASLSPPLPCLSPPTRCRRLKRRIHPHGSHSCSFLFSLLLAFLQGSETFVCPRRKQAMSFPPPLLFFISASVIPPLPIHMTISSFPPLLLRWFFPDSIRSGPLFFSPSFFSRRISFFSTVAHLFVASMGVEFFFFLESLYMMTSSTPFFLLMGGLLIIKLLCPFLFVPLSTINGPFFPHRRGHHITYGT